jgi:gas vesicle protein
MEKSNNTGKIVGAVLLGAVVGGAIGAALGMLFAPEKGSDLRKRLAASSDDLAGNLKNKFQNLVTDVKREVGSVKGTVDQFIEKAMTKNQLHN